MVDLTCIESESASGREPVGGIANEEDVPSRVGEGFGHLGVHLPAVHGMDLDRISCSELLSFSSWREKQSFQHDL